MSVPGGRPVSLGIVYLCLSYATTRPDCQAADLGRSGHVLTRCWARSATAFRRRRDIQLQDGSLERRSLSSSRHVAIKSQRTFESDLDGAVCSWLSSPVSEVRRQHASLGSQEGRRCAPSLARHRLRAPVPHLSSISPRRRRCVRVDVSSFLSVGLKVGGEGGIRIYSQIRSLRTAGNTELLSR